MSKAFKWSILCCHRFRELSKDWSDRQCSGHTRRLRWTGFRRHRRLRLSSERCLPSDPTLFEDFSTIKGQSLIWQSSEKLFYSKFLVDIYSRIKQLVVIWVFDFRREYHFSDLWRESNKTFYSNIKTIFNWNSFD